MRRLMCWKPPLPTSAGRQTRWWIKNTVAKFAQQLERMGSRLIIRRSADSMAVLRQLVAETRAQAVFFNHLYDSISMMRDNDIKDQLRGEGLVRRRVAWGISSACRLNRRGRNPGAAARSCPGPGPCPLPTPVQHRLSRPASMCFLLLSTPVTAPITHLSDPADRAKLQR